VPRQAPEPDIARYASRGISTDTYRYRCRLTVLAPAHVVADRIGPTIGVITPTDEGSCELMTGSDSLDELALYVGLLGHDILVHEPAELRAHMAALAARFTRAAEQPN
jgi:predicted DNA-binding transcriptional regulator YafY